MVDLKFVEKYEDVLQNIEFAIITVYREHPELIDHDVDAALEELAARYAAEQQGRAREDRELAGLRRAVLDAAHAVCEARLGRGPALEWLGDGRRVSAGEMAECLKRLRKSLKRWTKEGGRQGYLNFVRRYL